MSVEPVSSRWSPLRYSQSGLASFSPYVYVRDNPVIRIDPDGEVDKIAALKATGRIFLGLLTYQAGGALLVSSAAADPVTLGGTTAGIFAGIGVMTFGGYEMAMGGKDLQLGRFIKFCCACFTKMATTYFLKNNLQVCATESHNGFRRRVAFQKQQ